MKIYGLIPARSGSKRIPNKNILRLDGVPILAWSVMTSELTPEIEQTFVSTDSEEYADVATRWGAVAIMRPPQICLDSSTDFEVIEHFLRIHPCDLVVYLRPTTPIRRVELLGEAIKMLRGAGENASGLRSVEEMGESALKCFTLKPGPFLAHLGAIDLTDQPNQECPKTYHPNGYIDICKASEIAKGTLWGDKVIGFVTPRVIEIDTEDDYKYAEWWVAHRGKHEFVFKNR